jgi:acetoin utilization deacetylase AcuC-like enzyme
MTTAFVFHERYLWHESGTWSELSPWVQPSSMAEGPEAKRRIRNLLDISGLLTHLESIAPRPASRAEIERFHTGDYVDRIVELSGGVGGDAGGWSPFRQGAYDIALLSAGGVITAVDAVLDGRVDNAYALVRPPGHHASPPTGDGFCLFNNIGVAVRHAQHRGVGRIAVVDWDVHHGNGTEAGFYDDPTVLTVSVHQDGLFPLDSGHRSSNGTGRGAGANLNVPLPAGCGTGAYLDAMDRVVGPALRRFEPELIVVACGLDANFMDPLARMMLDSNSYRAMAGRLLELSRELCGGQLVLAHEGGYSPEVVPFCALAIIEEMSGHLSGVVDPLLAFNQVPGHDLLDHQRAAIDAAAALVDRVPSP